MSAYDSLLVGRRRRGVIVVLTAVLLAVMVGFVAFAIDVGVLCLARAEAQNTVDAAALAAAMELLDQDQLTGAPDKSDDIAAARLMAVEYAARNPIRYAAPVVDANESNNPGGDVVIGYLANPNDQSETMSFADPNQFNSVRVRVRRTPEQNGRVGLFFARIWGIDSADVTAEATATVKDGVVGFRVPRTSTAAQLLPLALHVDIWNQLLDGTRSTGDDYRYDADSGEVHSGSDDIAELNLYPGAGPTQLPPGNFGTVDIGSPGNSTSDLSRQILEGVSADDLAYHGGELSLGEDGSLTLNGDTGLSASIGSDLEAIIGMPRIIPLFDGVPGVGNTAMFHVVGFAGIRIMDVRLTGAMNSKYVIIQPGLVVDDTVITTGDETRSYFIYSGARLVR